jgi:hypothetical protein
MPGHLGHEPPQGPGHLGHKSSQGLDYLGYEPPRGPGHLSHEPPRGQDKSIKHKTSRRSKAQVGSLQTFYNNPRSQKSRSPRKLREISDISPPNTQ